MSLAIFDLDNTLIAGDSDHAWGEFLADEGWVDRELYRQHNDEFYRQYQTGQLDINAYLSFALAPLANIDPDILAVLQQRFLTERIRPMRLTKAADLIATHRERGDIVLIITATNRFVSEPVARLYDIDDIIATEPEQINGRFTGQVFGVPCFQDGKITRLETWLQESSNRYPSVTLTGSYFYSDSINDAPLLKRVDHAVAVDPDDRLRLLAQEQGWPIISLR